ncbi:MAG: ATP-binding protein, partial [Syntrophales bacterium]|nr:ATP-binding protein [Syntrophales bacterium]
TEKELVLSKADINLFSTFASHAGIIIENARLQEQYQKKIAQLLSLQEITKKTSSTLNLGKLLNFVTVNAMKITGASICTLLLVERDHLRIVSHAGHDGIDVERFKMKIGEGIAGWVAEKGVPLLVGDVNEEPRYIEFIHGVGSKLAVPLVSEKNILGVLVVDSYKKSAFSLDDLEILMVFTSHTAVVLDSVRLYEQVIAERNFAANILESSPNGIITIDENKKVRALNRKAEEILGIRRRNALNKKIHEVFECRGVLDLLNDTMDEQRIISNQELTITRKDGSTVILGFSSSLLKTDETGPAAMIITIQDMTEIKRTEALIRQVDRLSSLGQLSAGIAHEIRNPLASINFNAQLLAKKLVADKKTESIFKDTFEGIDRIKTLVKRILDFTKTGSPSFRRGHIHDTVFDSLALVEPQIKKRGLHIKKSFAEDLPEVVFDPHQIQQVFVNLLMNAAESMANGGTIEIKSMLDCGRPDAVHVIVSISDYGCGISKENISKIFDPFFTTKPDGTGLGLSIVYKILEQHDTRIEVKSKDNRGTTFILHFPVKLNQNNHVSA